MSLRAPLGHVRGLGSAKRGTEHFWQQRITAVLLAPLAVWVIAALVRLDLADYGAVVTWLREPINTLLLLLLITAACHHAQLGMQVVIEDYVHDKGQKIAGLVLVKFLALIVALASALGILRVFLG
jgi:succinate dehydrogenase / fumarate reductase membrane anchor subunit